MGNRPCRILPHASITSLVFVYLLFLSVTAVKRSVMPDNVAPNEVAECAPH